MRSKNLYWLAASRRRRDIGSLEQLRVELGTFAEEQVGKTGEEEWWGVREVVEWGIGEGEAVRGAVDEVLGE
jgi:hypothetical protein